MFVDIILLKSVDTLGSVSDVVRVKMGYAKNFLIRMGFAVLANKKNIAEIDAKKSELSLRDEANKDLAKSLKASCDNISIVLQKSAIQNGRLYGSISAKEITEALLEACKRTSLDVKPEVFAFVQTSGIRLSSDIKYIGEYKAFMVLYGDISLSFNIIVEHK